MLGPRCMVCKSCLRLNFYSNVVTYFRAPLRFIPVSVHTWGREIFGMTPLSMCLLSSPFTCSISCFYSALFLPLPLFFL